MKDLAVREALALERVLATCDLVRLGEILEDQYQGSDEVGSLGLHPKFWTAHLVRGRLAPAVQ